MFDCVPASSKPRREMVDPCRAERRMWPPPLPAPFDEPIGPAVSEREQKGPATAMPVSNPCFVESARYLLHVRAAPSHGGEGCV